VAGTAPSGNVFILDVEDGQSSEIPNSASWTWDLDFSSDGLTLAGVGQDGQVAIWDVESKTMSSLMSPDPDAPGNSHTPTSNAGLVQVDFLPDAEVLVTAGLDGSVRVWTIGDDRSQVLAALDFALNSIDVSADGETVVASDVTGNVRLIEIATGDERLPRPQGVPGPSKVVISPDGRHLAGGGPGPVVHLWEVESGEIVRRIGRALGPSTVAFVNGGQEIRAASTEGIVRAYVLDPLELLEIAKNTVGRDMTDEECQRFLRRPCDS
jgi:WD40 repeat protein